MKILYSQIKKLVPKLDRDIHEICDAFTLIGFMVDGLSEISYQGKADHLISLEIRQNRADCLSVFGLAREIASYYGMDADLPEVAQNGSKSDLPIKVNAESSVRRIRAIKFEGLQNGQSPEWLQELLRHFDVNPINMLVDLSNYVMLLTGYPSHLLDASKMSGDLAWSINDKFSEITTLDGNTVKLNKNEVILEDDQNILALAGVVGGKCAEIDENSKDIICEMAIYDRALIRRNARDLHIMTEASNRLEKDLDPNGIDFALDLLESMIIENCGGKAVSGFSYYPSQRKTRPIEFMPAKASEFAGVEILPEQSMDILKNLRFAVQEINGSYLVTPPSDRMDIELEEDIIEEVIRMYGYDKIPFDQIPDLKVVNNITPITVRLAERVRDLLATRGYDETLSWPLTEEKTNLLVKDHGWQTVRTVNSVNEDFPELRSSVAAGLVNQLETYKKLNVPQIQIFEIGKIFGKREGRYIEQETVGMLKMTKAKSLQEFKFDLESMLRSLGISDIRYKEVEEANEIANPHSAWKLVIHGQGAGMIYKLKSDNTKEHIYFAETDLSVVSEILDKKIAGTPAVAELTRKIVTLDANVVLDKSENPNDYLENIKEKIGANIWDIWIADSFPASDEIKYTIRVSYLEMADEQAKKIHLEVFELIK